MCFLLRYCSERSLGDQGHLGGRHRSELHDLEPPADEIAPNDVLLAESRELQATRALTTASEFNKVGEEEPTQQSEHNCRQVGF